MKQTFTTRELKRWFLSAMTQPRAATRTDEHKDKIERDRAGKHNFRLPRSSFRFFSNSTAQRFAVDLLDQQIWCWGQDIVKSDGNLLLRLGFSRQRQEGQSTRYFAQTPKGGSISLWGFGIVYSLPELGSVYLGRYEFGPLLHNDIRPEYDRSESWKSFFCPESASAQQRARHLVSAFCQWVAGYEHWVLETLGVTYRRDCLAERSSSPKVGPAEMAHSWESLEKKVLNSAGQFGFGGNWGRLLMPVRENAHASRLHSIPQRFAKRARKYDLGASR